jgi:hypothetical protein
VSAPEALPPCLVPSGLHHRVRQRSGQAGSSPKIIEHSTWTGLRRHLRGRLQELFGADPKLAATAVGESLDSEGLVLPLGASVAARGELPADAAGEAEATLELQKVLLSQPRLLEELTKWYQENSPADPLQEHMAYVKLCQGLRRQCRGQLFSVLTQDRRCCTSEFLSPRLAARSSGSQHLTDRAHQAQQGSSGQSGEQANSSSCGVH